jgi:transposase
VANPKQCLQREPDGRKKPRLQMLYILASGQAQTRHDVAQLLGVHRNTIGHWSAIYETGGLEALLAVYMPAGKPISLSPDVLAAIEQALQEPAGFAYWEALRQWVQQTHHVEVPYHTLYTIARTRFRSKLKVSRLSHTKNPDAIAEFQATCQEQLQGIIPLQNTHPVRVFSQDESRFGLLTIRRRRLTAGGIQPVSLIQHVFEWFYVYGAVAPTTGERFLLELPPLDAATFQLFLDAFGQAFPDSLNILLLDNSGAHRPARSLAGKCAGRVAAAILSGAEPDRVGLA